MNFDQAVFDPLYKVFGFDATLTIAPGSSDEQVVTLRVIDQTSGVEVAANNMTMPSIRPVAMCRHSELTTLGYQPDNLLEAELSLNGFVWTVKNVAPKPGAEGRTSGEVMLILINGDL